MRARVSCCYVKCYILKEMTDLWTVLRLGANLIVLLEKFAYEIYSYMCV